MTIQQALVSPRLSIENELIINLKNGDSGGSIGVYNSKSTFSDHQPYVIESREGVDVIVHNFHFLSEVRRQLSGTITDSFFGPAEQTHYDNYLDYVDGVVIFTGDELLLVEALDLWLIEEVQEIDQPVITREYNRATHPWRKLDLTAEQEI